MEMTLKPELAPAVEYGRSSQLSDVEDGGLQRSDGELVIAAQSGESSALGQLLVRHQKRLRCFARRFVASAADADDLVQETMLRAITNIDKFRGESRFATWLSAIVVNSALSRMRKEKHVHWLYLDEPKGADGQDSYGTLPDVRANPEDDYMSQELHELLQGEISKLDPKYRFLVTACVFDDRSLGQVAQSLGMKYGTAKSHLYRARRKLSAAMRRNAGMREHVHAGSRAL